MTTHSGRWFVSLSCSVLLAASAPALAAAPEVQDAYTVGFEVEGMLTVTLKDGKLSEKAYSVQDDTPSYGLPTITYQLDQIDRAKNPKAATAEIVTAPFAATEAGLKKLLEAVYGAYAKAPAQAAFVPSADFGGHHSTVRISKGRGAGSVQSNVTVPARNLVPDTDGAAKKTWGVLTEEKYVRKITPLVAGARDITDLLAKAADAPLHAEWDKKSNLRLWMYLWLARMSYEVGAGQFKIAGFFKDHHGCAIKMEMDPESSGLDPADGTAFANLHATHAALWKQIKEKAIAAVAASLGKTVNDVTDGWPADASNRPNSHESAASERPLPAKLVGGVLAPIVEARRSNSPINSAARSAIGAVVLEKKSADSQKGDLSKAMKDLF